MRIPACEKFPKTRISKRVKTAGWVTNPTPCIKKDVGFVILPTPIFLLIPVASAIILRFRDEKERRKLRPIFIAQRVWGSML
jgi:hypothetical protein